MGNDEILNNPGPRPWKAHCMLIIAVDKGNDFSFSVSCDRDSSRFVQRLNFFYFYYFGQKCVSSKIGQMWPLISADNFFFDVDFIFAATEKAWASLPFPTHSSSPGHRWSLQFLHSTQCSFAFVVSQYRRGMWKKKYHVIMEWGQPHEKRSSKRHIFWQFSLIWGPNYWPVLTGIQGHFR